MKFTLTFKTPDVFDQIDFGEPDKHSIDEEEWDEYWIRKQAIEKVCMKFLKYNEYVSIEFDTDAMTATVL